MNRRIGAGFAGGTLGGLILAAVMYALQGTGITGIPMFVQYYRYFFGAHPPLDLLFSSVLFVLGGGLWGAVFGGLIKTPTIAFGAMFGLLPSFWLWLVIAPLTGGWFFNGFTAGGILYPLVFNVGIWGSFLGWYCARSYGR